LSAAGLFSGESELNIELFQQVNHIFQGRREKLVGKTSDEQLRGGHR
jgi:hypothetical protein